MVRWAPRPSLREASCCRVEVVKGAGGCRRTCFFSTEATVKLGAASKIGVDQLLVDLARVPESIQHRGLGYLVKDHALHVDSSECLALAEHLLDMPGDRLALAVGVGREIEMVGALDCQGDLLEPLFGA